MRNLLKSNWFIIVTAFAVMLLCTIAADAALGLLIDRSDITFESDYQRRVREVQVCIEQEFLTREECIALARPIGVKLP